MVITSSLDGPDFLVLLNSAQIKHETQCHRHYRLKDIYIYIYIYI